MESIIESLKQKPERMNLNIDLVDKTNDDNDLDYDKILKELLNNDDKPTLKENIFDDKTPDSEVESPLIDEFSDIVEWKKNFVKTDIHLKTSDYYLYNREFFSTFMSDFSSE